MRPRESVLYWTACDIGSACVCELVVRVFVDGGVTVAMLKACTLILLLFPPAVEI